MASAQGKRLRPTFAAPRSRTRRRTLLAGLAGLLVVSACATRPRARAVSIGALETAAAVEPSVTRRAIVSDLAELDELYCPLGRRLGLLQIRTASQWETLRRCAPELGRCPDLTRGIVVGLVSHAGLPLNGTWPIHLDTVRVHDGAGFVTARFQGGSFLPDGTTYLETAQVDGLCAVLMVEVNGVRFYPD